MKHRTTNKFWDCYYRLPKEIQELADKQFALLRDDPRHPSLYFKRAGDYHSARVGSENGLVWFWIGLHDEYERVLG